MLKRHQAFSGEIFYIFFYFSVEFRLAAITSTWSPLTSTGLFLAFISCHMQVFPFHAFRFLAEISAKHFCVFSLGRCSPRRWPACCVSRSWAGAPSTTCRARSQFSFLASSICSTRTRRGRRSECFLLGRAFLRSSLQIPFRRKQQA